MVLSSSTNHIDNMILCCSLFQNITTCYTEKKRVEHISGRNLKDFRLTGLDDDFGCDHRDLAAYPLWSFSIQIWKMKLYQICK